MSRPPQDPDEAGEQRDTPPPRDEDPADRPEGHLTSRLRLRGDDDTLREHVREASAAAFRAVEESAPPGVRTRLRALRERIRSRRSLDTAWRMMVFTLGITFVVAGLVMFVIPGPGFATVILGLVILGSEFTWATRALNPVKDAARRAQEAALDPRRRRRNLILGAIGGVVLAGVLVWYLVTYGATVQPVMSWLQGLLAWLGGLWPW